MEITTIVMICLIIGVSGMAIYLLAFANKGRKVYLEFYEEMGDGNWYRIDPDKTYKGLIFRDKDSVEKLKIPRKFSKTPLEAANVADLIPSSRGVPVLMMAKDAEQLFRPMNASIADKKTFKAKVEQREPLSWLVNENERVNRDYQNKDFWTKYGAMVTLGIIVVGALLIIYVTADKINELNDDYRAQVLQDVREDRSWMQDLVNNIKGNPVNNVETSTNADKPPTAS